MLGSAHKLCAMKYRSLHKAVLSNSANKTWKPLIFIYRHETSKHTHAGPLFTYFVYKSPLLFSLSVDVGNFNFQSWYPWYFAEGCQFKSGLGDHISYWAYSWLSSVPPGFIIGHDLCLSRPLHFSDNVVREVTTLYVSVRLCDTQWPRPVGHHQAIKLEKAPCIQTY